MLALGDFLQLLPFAGDSLAAFLVKMSMTGGSLTWPGSSLTPRQRVDVHASDLFKMFRCICLTEQVRAGGDSQHCAMLERLSLSRTEPPITQAC